MTDLDRSAVSLVVCAAPLAGRAGEFVDAIASAGFAVHVVLTESACDWLNAEALDSLPTSAPRRAGEPGRSRKPGTVVVLPLTFNTLNQWAIGISDTTALGTLNSALGSGARILAVPVFNERLWAHPAVSRHLEALAGAGVAYIDANTGGDGAAMVSSGTGEKMAASFDPAWITSRLPPPATV